MRPDASRKKSPAAGKKSRTPGKKPPATEAGKLPFDIDAVIRALRQAVAPLPRAALFQLYDEGYRTLFQQLIACILSIRTLDEVTVPVARALFARAKTPAELAALAPTTIDTLIHPCTFHGPKSRTLHAIAQRAADEMGGELPCDFAALTTLKGVGPKCANLALGIACNQPHGIGVDIHVHRVTHRWGYVHAATPEKTMHELEQKIPRPYWVEINALLVPFGKHICRGKLPRCSTCPLLKWCRQVGVHAHQ